MALGTGHLRRLKLSVAVCVEKDVQSLWSLVGPFEQLASWISAIGSCTIEDGAHPKQVPPERQSAIHSKRR